MFGRTLCILMTFSFVAMSSQAQQRGGGPGFPCEKATTSIEILICSDPELSALDREYNQVYQQRLRDRNSAEVAEIRRNAREFLKTRGQNCVTEDLDANLVRPAALACVSAWYHWRLAEISEMPRPAPAKWTPRLMDAVGIYTNPNRGLLSTRAKKLRPDVYFKAPGQESFLLLGTDYPARTDRNTGNYGVYRDILGSLTYVRNERNQGQPNAGYFFDKDGRLAAQERQASVRVSDLTYYSESERVFYAPDGQETHRTHWFRYAGKLSAKREDLAPPPLGKPPFASLDAARAVFQDARRLDADQLGLVHLATGDSQGYGRQILNFAPEPLEVYERSILPMDYPGFNDPVNTGNVRGIIAPLGTLSGKRAFTVTYSSAGLIGILVEREPDRYLPVFYYSDKADVLTLEIATVEGQEILAYVEGIPGTGQLTDHWYFALDRGIPKSLEYQTVLLEAIQKTLPKGASIGRGSRFDLRTLTFGAPTRGDIVDKGRGWVEVKFAIEKARFVVKSAKWTQQPDTDF